jgi:hypothetical protein
MLSFVCKGIKYFGMSMCTKSVLYDKKQAKIGGKRKHEKNIII